MFCEFATKVDANGIAVFAVYVSAERDTVLTSARRDSSSMYPETMNIAAINMAAAQIQLVLNALSSSNCPVIRMSKRGSLTATRCSGEMLSVPRFTVIPIGFGWQRQLRRPVI